MSTLRLVIKTPHETVFDAAIVSVTIPLVGNDSLSVLAGHAPMVAQIVDGTLTIKTAQGARKSRVGQGIMQVSGNEAVALVHMFEWDDEA